MKHPKLIGAMHPFLFLIVMYIVALAFALFICSSIFFAFSANNEPDEAAKVEYPKK